MKGKAIYNPSGRAGEYSYWAVNFYNGCSADCDYCYCKRGVLSSVWSTTPTLKKCLTDPDNPSSIDRALEIFKKEATKNLKPLQEHGLFFNFTSDPFLRETFHLTLLALDFCHAAGIPTKLLTKQTWWVGMYGIPSSSTIGFTLTGMDDMERGAATNAERIEALQRFNRLGYKTWASIEPVVDISESIKVIQKTWGIVDHYKIGTLSGKKYDVDELMAFVEVVTEWSAGLSTVYWKKELLKQAGVPRSGLPNHCVTRDYRWWV